MCIALLTCKDEGNYKKKNKGGEKKEGQKKEGEKKVYE